VGRSSPLVGAGASASSTWPAVSLSLATPGQTDMRRLVTAGRGVGRILMSTLGAGVTSVLVLCYLAIGETRNRWLGIVGGVAATASAMSALGHVLGSLAARSGSRAAAHIRGLGNGGTHPGPGHSAPRRRPTRRHGRAPTAWDSGGRHCPRRALDRRCPRLESGGTQPLASLASSPSSMCSAQ
jgi:hypothetical protein